MFSSTRFLLPLASASTPRYFVRGFTTSSSFRRGRSLFLASDNSCALEVRHSGNCPPLQTLLKKQPRKVSSLGPAMSTSTQVEYLCVHVFVNVKKLACVVRTPKGTEEAFKIASLENARNSAKEEGISRFDVIQQNDDPTKFVLVEVYKNADAPAAHKETAHYLAWRETVADMMAEPRKAIKYTNLFPSTNSGWDYGAGEALE